MGRQSNSKYKRWMYFFLVLNVITCYSAKTSRKRDAWKLSGYEKKFSTVSTWSTNFVGVEFNIRSFRFFNNILNLRFLVFMIISNISYADRRKYEEVLRYYVISNLVLFCFEFDKSDIVSSSIYFLWDICIHQTNVSSRCSAF